MTYEQAYATLRTYFGKDPSQVTSAQLQSAYIPLFIPLELRSKIQQAWYAAQRTGADIRQELINKGLITNVEAASTPVAPLPTLSGSQFAQQNFAQTVAATNPDMTPFLPTTTTQPISTISAPPIFSPSPLAAQESGAIGAASIASQMAAAAPTTTTAAAPTFTAPSAITSTAPTTTTSTPTFTAPSAVTSIAPTTIPTPTLTPTTPTSNLFSSKNLTSKTMGYNVYFTNPDPINGYTFALPLTLTASGITHRYNAETGQWTGTDWKGQTSTIYADEIVPKIRTGEFVLKGDTLIAGTPTRPPVAPSPLAAQESGAIGAASIAAQMKVPTATTTTTPTTATTTPTVSPVSVSPVTTPPAIPVPTLPTVPVKPPTEVPTFTNPITAAPVTAKAPVIQVPTTVQIAAGTTATPAMGGTPEEQDALREAIRRLTANKLYAETEGKYQQADVRARAETQIRKAGRDLYAAQLKSLASLGARGISGAPGLSVAARRAAGAEPEYRRQGLISERDRQVSALNRALTKQLADYEEQLRLENAKLTRATTLANQLATGVK